MRTFKRLALSILGVMLFLSLCMFTLTVTVRADGETVSYDSFAMEKGASIRVINDASENLLDDAGIRFTATMDKAEFAKIEGTVEAGVFMMPKSYVAEHGDINEANCFGGEAVYYWGEEQVGATKTRILHLSAEPYEDGDVIRINGSVVKLLPNHFDLNYYGVAYIAVTNGGSTEYHFASTTVDNSRSPLKVAQLCAIDTASYDDSVETTCEAYYGEYIKNYKAENSGEMPTITYTQKAYKERLAGFEEDLSEQKTVDYDNLLTRLTFNNIEYMTNNADYDIVDESDAVYAIPGETAVVERTLALNNDDYSAFDLSAIDETKTTIASSHTKYYDENSNELVDIQQSGNKAPEAYASLSQDWTYGGDYSIRFRVVASGDWEYVEFKNDALLTFPATKTITMVINSSEENRAMQFWPTTDKGSFYITPEGQTCTNNTFTLYKGVHKYQFNLSSEITQISKLGVVDSGNATVCTYYIGNIVGEKELEISSGTEKHANVVLNESVSTYDIISSKTAFLQSLSVKSSVYTTAEAMAKISGDIDVTVSYSKLLDASPAVSVSENQDKFTMPVVDNQDYNINLNVTLDGENISTESYYLLGYYGKGLLLDFEGTNTYMSSRANGYYGSTGTKTTVSGDVSIDNGKSWHMPEDGSEGWWGFAFDDADVGDVDTICFWMYNAKTIRTIGGAGFGANIAWMNASNNSSLYATNSAMELEPGWHYFEFNIPTAPGTIKQLAFNIRYPVSDGITYIDRIAFKKLG